jgi:hypothetical protein
VVDELSGPTSFTAAVAVEYKLISRFTLLAALNCWNPKLTDSTEEEGKLSVAPISKIILVLLELAKKTFALARLTCVAGDTKSALVNLMTKNPWVPEVKPNPSVGELLSTLAATEQLALLLDELDAGALEDDELATKLLEDEELEDDFIELLLELDLDEDDVARLLEERELELQAIPLGKATLLLESLFAALTASVSVE